MTKTQKNGKKKIDGPTLEAKASEAKTAAQANGTAPVPPISKELFRQWCTRDLSAARAFLTALAKRPHLVEEMADQMYDSMQFNNQLDNVLKQSKG